MKPVQRIELIQLLSPASQRTVDQLIESLAKQEGITVREQGINHRTLEVQRVCKLAKALGITRKELADKWNISVRQVYFYLSGEDLPSDKVFTRIYETGTTIKNLLNSR